MGPCIAKMAGALQLLPNGSDSLKISGAARILPFGMYIGKITNTGEWKEVFLDYCHHKRTVYSPNPLDKVARTVLNLLKFSPKCGRPGILDVQSEPEAAGR